MNRLHYFLGPVRVNRCHDAALVAPGDDLTDRLRDAVLETISADVPVTVGGVTLHLAAWLDPDGWFSDWVSELGLNASDEPDVEQAVHDLLAGSVSDLEAGGIVGAGRRARGDDDERGTP